MFHAGPPLSSPSLGGALSSRALFDLDGTVPSDVAPLTSAFPCSPRRPPVPTAPGHVQALQHARSFGDFLLVGVHTDESVQQRRGAHLPILSLHERSLSVLSCKYVDEVIIGAPWAVTQDLLTTFNVSVVVSGAAQREARFPALSLMTRRPPAEREHAPEAPCAVRPAPPRRIYERGAPRDEGGRRGGPLRAAEEVRRARAGQSTGARRLKRRRR